MRIPLYVICCFSLIALNIFSLHLIFVNLINMYLETFLPEFILLGTLHFLDLGDSFHSHVREVFSYYLQKYFLRSFLSSSATPLMQMLVGLILSQTACKLSSFLFFILFYGNGFHNPVFQITYPFILVCSAITSSVFFISVIVLSILLFKFSSSLLNISCSSQSMPLLFFPDLRSSLLPLLWILLQVDLPIFTSLSCSSGILSCFLIQSIFLCHLILSDFLCLQFPGCWIVFPLAFGDCLMACVAGLRGFCASWLMGGIGACPLVSGAGSCSSGVCTTLLIVWPEASQHWSLRAIGWGQVLASQWQPLGQLTPVSTLQYFFHQCSCPGREPQSYPTPQETLLDKQVDLALSPVKSLLLALGPGLCEILCAL